MSRIIEKYKRNRRAKKIRKLRKFAQENMGKECTFNWWDKGVIVGYNPVNNGIILGFNEKCANSWDLPTSFGIIYDKSHNFYVNLKFEHAK